MKYLIDYNMNANHHSIQQVESIDHHIHFTCVETKADFIQIDYSDIVSKPEDKVDEIYNFAMKSEHFK